MSVSMSTVTFVTRPTPTLAVSPRAAGPGSVSHTKTHLSVLRYIFIHELRYIADCFWFKG
jgi:hypothetical protein